MTEKRFEYDKDTCCFLDHNEWGIKVKSIEEIEKLLNAFYEENQALKSDRVRYEEECRLDVFKELMEENQKLKKENQGIQNKVIRLLDFVEIKKCVTRTEIKKWWNDD